MSTCDEIVVHDVTFPICELCLTGKGGECHSPGCAFFICPALDDEQAERVRFYAPGGAGYFMGIYDEMRAEREAAHAKHGETSMEAAPVAAMFRAVILGEEVGEVAEVAYLLWSAALTAKASYVQKAMNDGRHNGAVDLAKLRRELVQVATMAAAWADRIELLPSVGDGS